MGTATATAESPAAPKPQPLPPPMPRYGPDHPPPPAMTVAELEAAVAALPGKRDALREAFDRLAACSPTPLPFAWEDLDAHLSWLQSSISLRFRQVRALESARPAPAVAALGETRGHGAGEQLEGEEEVGEVEEVVLGQEEGEKADEDMQEGDDNYADDEIGRDGVNEKGGRVEVLEVEEEVEEATDDQIGNEIKDEKDAKEEQDADEEMYVSNEEEQSTEDGKKASQYKEEDSNMEMEGEQSTKDAKKASLDKEEQNIEDAKKASLDKEEDANMEEAATKKASTLQGKEQEACSEKHVEDKQEAHEEKQDAKNTTKEVVKAKDVDQASQVRPGPCVFNDLAAAFASMDAQRLVKLIHTVVGLSSEFHAAMHHAQDGAALSLHVVELFLHDKMPKSNKVWANCVGLIRAVPEVVTKLSTESIERAKQLAKDWRGMIDSPGTCTALSSLASWGLLNFLIAYNIVSEFDMEEIFRIFGTIPRKHQKKNHSMLFKGLGLADRIPELMDYLIGNGQHVNVLYLAPFLNLVDKYPPFLLLKGYVEKAKQTVMEISQKNMTRKSVRAVIVKELDNLRMARDLANQRITDSSLHTCIMAEIYVLLGEFGKMKQSLADASPVLTSNPQQQQTGSNKKRRKEQEHHKAQENQQQGKQSKPGNKLEKKQNNPQQEQQQKEKDKPQEKQQENKHQHLKRPRKRTRKQPARASPAARNVPLGGHIGHPPYAAMHGVHHGYPAQPGWSGVHCAPLFAPQPGAPAYIGPINPFYPRPEQYPR